MFLRLYLSQHCSIWQIRDALIKIFKVEITKRSMMAWMSKQRRRRHQTKKKVTPPSWRVKFQEGKRLMSEEGIKTERETDERWEIMRSAGIDGGDKEEGGVNLIGRSKAAAGRKKQDRVRENGKAERERELCHHVSLCKSSNICLMHSLSPNHPLTHTHTIPTSAVSTHCLSMSQQHTYTHPAYNYAAL